MKFIKAMSFFVFVLIGTIGLAAAKPSVLKLRLVCYNKVSGHPYQLSRKIKVYSGKYDKMLGMISISGKAKGIRIYEGDLKILPGNYESLFIEYLIGYHRRKRIPFGRIFKKEFVIKPGDVKRMNINYQLSDDARTIDGAFLDKKIDIQKLNDPYYTGHSSSRSGYKLGSRVKLLNTKF